jgi:hypothetical protein
MGIDKPYELIKLNVAQRNLFISLNIAHDRPFLSHKKCGYNIMPDKCMYT